ncbi:MULTISPECIES: pantetheine-phosphate adenylyltransferase [Myxococcus]|uniref:Phosphopantetheine adenylyltransferase n=2 Tax=Myxococcus TaxID=32 RepID=A0A511HK81_9BACT|nr:MULTISPECIES: pantetheine-phosphate adenylyltransferase [Myxococcus]NOJ80453.1 pantetheine-phosphate adenylyltransferase [Myxococcus xanthus]NOJ87443.1 pantetheine-phosphate adenylyltransferase [Myxococcus xanthus]QDE92014.1 pantetheine-phosphate adenylyltransferase [Myxococcus xanthus]SDE07191.1 Phosphopantetheine adenylyltransferase [Myxococcus virescens]GEL72949.1 phosphopantetheine adenylyltransferase [Myxococcus virescens]
MTIAVYAGSFDPVTAGHMSVVRQAARLFGHVVVVVAVNPDKQSLLSADERVALLREAVAHHPNVTVARTQGLIVDFARDIGASVLLRGVRGATDAQFETTLAQNNRALAPELSTLFLPAEAHLAEVSSSGLKARVARGEDVSAFCPPAVAAKLRERLDPSLRSLP